MGPEKGVSVNYAYFSEVASVKSGGSVLSEVDNKLGEADSSLKVTNITDANRMYETYKKIFKSIEAYGKMVVHDVGNLRQAGENQQNTDRAYGGR